MFLKFATCFMLKSKSGVVQSIWNVLCFMGI